MNPHHLPRLQSLHHENPTKRISLIRLAWPDIEKALARGHTLKLIHSRLVEDGLQISYSLLSLYVRRLQGKESSKKDQPHPILARKASLPTPGADRQPESLATNREQGPPQPAPPRNLSVKGPQRRGLLDPRELMGENANDPDSEGCFFKERVPDINELFRVTKST
jgi:hypothetical protein